MPSNQDDRHLNPSRTIAFEIERFKTVRIDPPRFQSYILDVHPAMTVLDALERIRLTQDSTLVYRHCCHHSACGTCACIINGVERLACITRVFELQADTVTLAPLRGFARIADLAVEMTGFYRDIDPDWQTLKPAERIPDAAPSAALRLEECIECGACVSACPAAHYHAEFMGPAALAALHNEMKKRPVAQHRRMLQTADSPRGQRMCERALTCNRVCPTQVYPARHIADLRRMAGES